MLIQKYERISKKILLELIRDYSKDAGYKGNTGKSIAFPHTRKEQVESEIKNTTPWILAPKTNT